MTPHQIVAVALRLLAIWLGIEALRIVPSFFLVGTSGAPGTMYALFTLAITAVFALALWFFPYTIAGKMFPSQSTESPPLVAPDTWLAMGSALIGLWILATTVPSLVLDIFELNYIPGGSENNFPVLRWIIYNVVEVAIALWLVLGAKGFRTLFWWARNAGINKAL